jgi:AraC family transcriptional regulator, exoenzyme S synthesis regulatory protein ExsA
VDDLLFVEYHCIIEQVEVGFWTPNNYLTYVLTGKKQWRDFGVVYTGMPNDALFFKRGGYIAHQYFEEEFCALMIFLPDDFIIKVILKHQITSGNPSSTSSTDSIIPINIDESLTVYFQSVLNYFSKNVPPPKELLTVKFEELIINILLDKRNMMLAEYFKKITADTKISIREVMESNFTYHMSLEEFARLSGRSLSTFHRDFKKIYNCSPGKWLVQKHLQFSKYLLSSTEKSISQISMESGFKHPSHFSRSFKKTFGLPPSSFRK